MLLRVFRGSEHEQETLGVMGSHRKSQQYTSSPTTNLAERAKDLVMALAALVLKELDAVKPVDTARQIDLNQRCVENVPSVRIDHHLVTAHLPGLVGW